MELGAAGSRPSAGRDPGWRGGSWGRCCLRSPRLWPPRCPAGWRKPSSPIQTSVKLAGELAIRVTWRALGNLAPAPFAPQSRLAGRLKGTCGLCPRAAPPREGSDSFARSLQGWIPIGTPQPPQHHGKGREPQPGALERARLLVDLCVFLDPGFSLFFHTIIFRTSKIFIRHP
jgi:hypothetical protein